MKLLAVVIGTLMIAGCAGDDEPTRSPEETAEAWVAAINEGHYEEACDLSVTGDEIDCVAAMEAKPFGDDLRVEGFSEDEQAQDEVATFALSSADDRKPRGDGWTAYAAREGFSVEREDDGYLVHFEVSVIK